MTETPKQKLRVDQSEITLAELADVEDLLGCALSQAFERSQARAIAALVWVIKRRSDPDFSYAEAQTYRIGDLEMVTTSGEAPSGVNGQSPLGSPVSGV